MATIPNRGSIEKQRGKSEVEVGFQRTLFNGTAPASHEEFALEMTRAGCQLLMYQSTQFGRANL